MRTISQTHPWITFEINLKPARPKLWLLLGEAKSKCNHLAGVPLMPRIANELHEIFLAKGVHATTAIEGNTLPEKEVLNILRKTDTTPPSQEYLKREVENVLNAANEILDDVEAGKSDPITIDDIKRYNILVLDGLEFDDHVVPGEITRVQVGVPRYKGAPPELCESLLINLCEWLNSELFNRDDDDNKEVSGLLKAIVAHVYFVWIHAFGDGNGRTARLMEIRFLLEAGIPSVAGHLLSNHYNKTRTEYYRQLDMASKNGGDLLPFIEYAIGGFVEQIREQLDLVKSQQWEVAWRNHVYEQFANRNSKTDKRRRDLVLALSAAESPVPKRRLRRVTGALAESYASLTEKTVTRDINAIMQMGLVGRTENGYYARKGIILQFLPRAKKETIEAQLKSAVERMTALDLDDVFIA